MLRPAMAVEDGTLNQTCNIKTEYLSDLVTPKPSILLDKCIPILHMRSFASSFSI